MWPVETVLVDASSQLCVLSRAYTLVPDFFESAREFLDVMISNNKVSGLIVCSIHILLY